MDLSLHSQVDTQEEDVLCLCAGRPAAGSREYKLLTGHRTLVKLWAPATVPGADASPQQSIKLPTEGDVTCICQSPVNEYHYGVSVDSTVLLYDLRELSEPTQRFDFNSEEINEIDFHPKATYLSSCDDSGEIKIIDIGNGSTFRTLSGGHSNICSSVKFIPNRPWEVVSGGLDCQVIRWDLGRGRPIHKVVSEQVERGGYVVNPPMVHSVDMVPSSSLVVCGLGDGSIAVHTLTGKGLELACSLVVHSAAVSQVRCFEIFTADERRPIVVSGGNDCKVIVSELVTRVLPSTKRKSHKKAKSPASTVLQTLASVTLATKVNWIDVRPCMDAPAPTGTGGASAVTETGCLVYVADQSRFVSIYHFVV